MREGYYSDQYFNLTRDLLEHEDRHPAVLMQVFQKQESMLGGIDEAIAILRECSGRPPADGGWEPAGTGSRSARCTRATRSRRARR